MVRGMPQTTSRCQIHRKDTTHKHTHTHTHTPKKTKHAGFWAASDCSARSLADPRQPAPAHHAAVPLSSSSATKPRPLLRGSCCAKWPANSSAARLFHNAVLPDTLPPDTPTFQMHRDVGMVTRTGCAHDRTWFVRLRLPTYAPRRRRSFAVLCAGAQRPTKQAHGSYGWSSASCFAFFPQCSGMLGPRCCGSLFDAATLGSLGSDFNR